MTDTHIYCKLYGVQHRLRITAYNFMKQPNMITVDSSDVLKMIPRVNVGAAYDTYTPFNVLKAGKADFKIRLMEKTDAHVWRYVFEDYRGQMFETYLVRRHYETPRDCNGVVIKGQTTKVM